MLNLKDVLKRPDYYRAKLENKFTDLSDFEAVLELGQKRGELLHAAQELKAQINKLSKDVGACKDKIVREALITNLQILKKNQQNAQEEADELEAKLHHSLIRIPNVQVDEVPVGEDESANLVVKKFAHLGVGKKGLTKSHADIAREFNLINFDDALNLSGTRFIYYVGQGAKLVRALQNFFLDQNIARGYEEYIVPVIVRPEMMFGTGQLPKFEEDAFKLNTGHYLISTSEISLTNVYNNQIVDLTDPKKLTAYSDCFRSEIGSGGKDNKGIIRMHQFRKVELVKVTRADNAYDEFMKMNDDVHHLLTALEIPYQQLLLSSGDTGFSSQITYDYEIWLPSEQRYRETSSVSWMGDFQARRAMIRYRDESNEVQYAHSMNGSGLALDRVMAVLIELGYDENTQTIAVPKVLQPYFGASKISLKN